MTDSSPDHSSNQSCFRLACIGGGYSARVLLSTLSQVSCPSLSVVLYEPEEVIGTGMPYGSLAHEQYLLNSPVERLSLGDSASDLETWLETQESLDWELVCDSVNQPLPHRYITRRLFGDYIRWRFPLDRLSPAIQLSHVRERGLSLERDGTLWVVHSEQQSQSYDAVVLTTGSPQNAELPVYGKSDSYFSNLYTHKATIEHVFRNSGNRIALLGTSSAFLDAIRLLQVLNLEEPPTLVALSTSGELPAPGFSSTPMRSYQLKYLTMDDTIPPVETLLKLLTQERIHAFSQGTSILELRAAVNEFMERYLPQLSQEDAHQFLTQSARKFESLMKRGCPAVIEFAEHLLDSGSLQLVRGYISEVRTQTDGHLSIQLHTDHGVETLTVSHAINCLGPGPLSSSSCSLVQSLLQEGHAKPSVSDAGFDVADDFSMSEGLFAFGPSITGSCNRYGIHHHLENAKRIYALAETAAHEIATSLTRLHSSEG